MRPTVACLELLQVRRPRDGLSQCYLNRMHGVPHSLTLLRSDRLIRTVESLMEVPSALLFARLI